MVHPKGKGLECVTIILDVWIGAYVFAYIYAMGEFIDISHFHAGFAGRG